MILASYLHQLQGRGKCDIDTGSLSFGSETYQKIGKSCLAEIISIIRVFRLTNKLLICLIPPFQDSQFFIFLLILRTINYVQRYHIQSVPCSILRHNAKIVESLEANLWFITVILGTAIKTNATKLLNDLRITRQNLLATFIDEVAKPEQVFVSDKNQTKPINGPIFHQYFRKN